MNDPRGFPRFSIGRRRLLTYAVSSPVMPIVAGFGVNLATPSSAVADPQIQWAAHMEGNNLSEWDEEVNIGNADTTVVTSSVGVTPHGGTYMMQQSMTGTGGTMMQRYPEVDALSRQQTTYYYSFYHYLPSAISYSNGTYMLWGLNSSDGAAGYVFWALALASSDGTGALDLIWNPYNSALGAGPFALSHGNKYTFAGLAANRLPIGQWNYIEIMISPSWAFEGQIAVWQNGTLIHELLRTNRGGGVTTQWSISNPPQNLLAWIDQEAYGSGLPPTPTINYVDDVTVSLNRLPYDPQILWSAHMEAGTLAEWDDEVNSGTGDTTVVQAENGITPHGGTYMAKQSVTGTGSNATRLSIYNLLRDLARAGTSYYYTFWHYMPWAITFAPSDTFIFWGSESSINDATPAAPWWDLVLHATGVRPGTDGAMDFVWSPNNQAPYLGPHEGESGGKRIYNGTTVIPIGQWNKFEIFIKPRSDYTGQMKVWLNGVVEFDMTSGYPSGVKTMFPDIGQNLLLFTEQTCYGSNLTQNGSNGAITYLDDVTVSLGRMP